MTRTSTPDDGVRLRSASCPLRAMTTSWPFIRRASASTRRTDASSSRHPPWSLLHGAARSRACLPTPTTQSGCVQVCGAHREDMTSTIDGSPAPAGRLSWRTGPARPWLRQARRLPVVWVVAIVAVGLRLPLLSRPPSPDEAGFLLVGGQWHSGGTSLVRRLLGRPAAAADHPLPDRRGRRRTGAAADPRLPRDRAHHPGRRAPRSPARRSRRGRVGGARRRRAARQPADRCPVGQRRAAGRAVRDLGHRRGRARPPGRTAAPRCSPAPRAPPWCAR